MRSMSSSGVRCGSFCLGTASVSVEVAAGVRCAACRSGRSTRCCRPCAGALHGKGWTGAIAQPTLQRSAVVGFDADTGVDREAAVFVALHVFGVTALQQAPCNEGAQDAFARSLHLGHGRRIDAAWPGGIRRLGARGLQLGASALPSPSTSSNTPSTTQTWKWTCSVQAGAEPVNEGHCADVQVRLVLHWPRQGNGLAGFVQ